MALFHDRRDAGRELAGALLDVPTGDAVVVGLARGGMEVAAEVARVLELPLDVVAVRKVGHPVEPEYAIGAVAPGSDGVYLRASDGLTESEIAAAVARAKAAADQLDRMLHGLRAPVDLPGRAALLVDDGLATGATMVAAIRWARGLGATRIVVAVPVAAAESSAPVRREADVFVCPYELAEFGAVGLWYDRFAQVSDEDVLRILEEADRGPAGEPAVRRRSATA